MARRIASAKKAHKYLRMGDIRNAMWNLYKIKKKIKPKRIPKGPKRSSMTRNIANRYSKSIQVSYIREG